MAMAIQKNGHNHGFAVTGSILQANGQRAPANIQESPVRGRIQYVVYPSAENLSRLLSNTNNSLFSYLKPHLRQ